jgi:hypothetical protein
LSRNNPERTGAKDSADAPPSEVTKSLQFVTPTEFVELPSRGKGYPEGHPLCGEEVIEIRFMTAKDEDILSSQTLLKKGLAIERFMQNIIIDKNIRTNSLMVGDRNAIIIAARKSGYGNMYETKVTCPGCGEVSEFAFDLNNPTIKESDLNEEFNISETNQGTFMVVAPLSKFKVELRILTGQEELNLAEKMKSRKKKKLAEALVSDQLKLMIVSVEGSDSRHTVNAYVNNMPTQDSRFLRFAYKAISPDVKVTEDFECNSCGHEQELEVSFGADFFWPDR